MKDAQNFVCPVPMVWNEIWSKLCAIAAIARFEKPPVPLILAAWWETSDLDKMVRWKETIEWADRHALRDQIPELNEEQKHYVGD
jgi:hypothetical protein